MWKEYHPHFVGGGYHTLNNDTAVVEDLVRHRIPVHR